MEQKWYAVYTKPRWEKKVAEALSRNDIENYCPLNKVTRQWSDRKKIIEEPLFTSYVFVRIDNKYQTNVRKVDGVVNFVYWLGKPALIRDHEIELIKHFLAAHTDVKVRAIAIGLKDRVKVIEGPLISYEGQVYSLKSDTVKITIPSLGFCLTAEIHKKSIQVIEKLNN